MPTNRSKTGKKMVEVDTTLVRPKVQPPKVLKGLARKCWLELTRTTPNEQFTESDFVVLSAYCQQYAAMVEASQHVDVEGRVLEDERGKKYINPWHTILKESTVSLANTSVKLRLCPSARIKIDAVREKAPKMKSMSQLGRLINS